jgi:hypothetical protein
MLKRENRSTRLPRNKKQNNKYITYAGTAGFEDCFTAVMYSKISELSSNEIIIRSRITKNTSDFPKERPTDM